MTPEWEIAKGEFLRRLACSESDFKAKLKLPNIKAVKRVIPLRYLRHIESVVPVSQDMLFYLISKMATLDGRRPFEHSSLQLFKVDPNHLKIGQKFAYRENYQGLLEEIPGMLNQFVIATGLGDLGAYFAFGTDGNGISALACYLPPLIEQHGADLVIMDGIHRNYITKQMGQTMKAILIKNVKTPFPCGIRPWSDLKVISLRDKPVDIGERYFDLKKYLFRNLKYLGIDG